MAKLPSIQFYPGDWLRDAVSGCSLAAQGLWLRMMIVAHESERYGYLQVNGCAMQAVTIARRCGCDLPEYESLLCELVAAGVPSMTAEKIIFSRRMVRDQSLREARSCAGKKGGRGKQNESKTKAKGEHFPEDENEDEDEDSFPPSLKSVRAYCSARGNSVDPEQFVAHYNANGWVQSSGRPIKDWKAAVITWEKNERNRPRKGCLSDRA